MTAALCALGAEIKTSYNELNVRPITSVQGGQSIDCGLAGTVMRFCPPIAMLAAGPVRFTGDPHASTRPMAPLLAALSQLGASVDSAALPFTLNPPATIGGLCDVDASESSQFISGPLLAAARYPNGLVIRSVGDRLPSRPHIDMTVAMLAEHGVRVEQPSDTSWRVFGGPIAAGDQRIAPDLTNAAVFLAAALLTRGSVTIENWPTLTNQPGAMFLQIAEQFGGAVSASPTTRTVTGAQHLTGIDVDLSAASELTPVVAACAAFAAGRTRIRGVAHIRGHETDRLAAISNELMAAGVDVRQTPDGLDIVGNGLLVARRYDTYADHRMAHLAALMGLRVPGSSLDDVSVTSKTMPTFDQLWTSLCDA